VTGASGVFPTLIVAGLMMLFLGVDLGLLDWRRPFSSRCGACGRIVPRSESCPCSRR